MATLQNIIQTFITADNLKNYLLWHETCGEENVFRLHIFMISIFCNGFVYTGETLQKEMNKIASGTSDLVAFNINEFFNAFLSYPPFITHMNYMLTLSKESINNIIEQNKMQQPITQPRDICKYYSIGDEWINVEFVANCKMSHLIAYLVDNPCYGVTSLFDIHFYEDIDEDDDATCSFYEQFKDTLNKYLNLNGGYQRSHHGYLEPNRVVAFLLNYPSYLELAIQTHFMRKVNVMHVNEQMQTLEFYDATEISHRLFANDYVMQMMCKFL
jgi:hypothetical protein